MPLLHILHSFCISRTGASGEQDLYETLHTKLGMESLDLEEVHSFWFSSLVTTHINSLYKSFFSPPQVLVYLQLCKNISTVIVADWQKVTDHVCAVTKALAKRPFRCGVLSRRTRQTSDVSCLSFPPFPSSLLTERAELPFCTEGSWASGVRVERDGSGLTRVWSRQLQQLNRVSPAVASAVAAAFPSPQLLLQVPPEERTSRPVDVAAFVNESSHDCRRTGAWQRRRTGRGCWPRSQ